MSRSLVVGAAVVRRGQVLAARRAAPSSAAGRWEFPGGKAEVGESPETALVRELREELDLRVRVICWLEGAVPAGAAYLLRVAVCETSGTPTLREHDELRWLGAEELDTVAWLEPDLPFLPELRERLRDGATTVDDGG